VASHVNRDNDTTTLLHRQSVVYFQLPWYSILYLFRNCIKLCTKSTILYARLCNAYILVEDNITRDSDETMGLDSVHANKNTLNEASIHWHKQEANLSPSDIYRLMFP